MDSMGKIVEEMREWSGTEPVAWMAVNKVTKVVHFSECHPHKVGYWEGNHDITPLFAAPPAPAVEKYKSAIAELCDCFEDVMNGRGGWSWEEVIQDARNFIETAPPAPALPDGWKLVPVEPTPDMISALHAGYWGDPVVKTYETMMEESRELWRRTYTKMLAAAPEREG